MLWFMVKGDVWEALWFIPYHKSTPRNFPL